MKSQTETIDALADANRPLSLIEIETYARHIFSALLRCDGSESPTAGGYHSYAAAGDSSDEVR